MGHRLLRQVGRFHRAQLRRGWLRGLLALPHSAARVVLHREHERNQFRQPIHPGPFRLCGSCPATFLSDSYLLDVFFFFFVRTPWAGFHVVCVVGVSGSLKRTDTSVSSSSRCDATSAGASPFASVLHTCCSLPPRNGCLCALHVAPGFRGNHEPCFVFRLLAGLASWLCVLARPRDRSSLQHLHTSVLTVISFCSVVPLVVSFRVDRCTRFRLSPRGSRT